jgi:transcriptional regulator with XRE-family HTH domain
MPNPLLRQQIGRAIARERDRQGLTQTELARAVGIAQNTLSRYEDGTRPIPIDTFEQIARALRQPIGHFLPVDELPANWRGAVGVLDGLAPEDRAMVVEAIIAVIAAVRSRQVQEPHSSARSFIAV